MPIRNVPGLTGIRFFAAAAIVLHHSQNDYFFDKGTFEGFALDRAVHLFFALSGFVLALNAHKYSSFRDFVVDRIARIWPAHLFGLLLCVGILFPGNLRYLAEPSQFGLLALNLGLLQAWSPDMRVVFSYNAPSWSVSCEMFFYVAFLPIFRAMVADWRLRAPLVAVGLGLALWGGRALAVSLGFTDENWLQYINPVVNLPVFALGILAGILLMRSKPVRPSFAIASLIQAVALLLALFADHLPPYQGSDVIGLPMGRFGGELKAAVFFCLLFYALSRLDGVVSRALSVRPVVYMGEISYSIYLVHETIIVWIASDHEPLAGLPLWAQGGIGVVAILALAALSHACIERPFRRWIRNGWRSARRGIAVVGSTSS